MTATLPSARPPVLADQPLPVGPHRPTWTIGAPRLLAGLGGVDRLGPVAGLDLRAHTAVHGPLPATDRSNLLALLDASRLAGRGGAGFDFATKLRALAGSRPTVVVNGSESEPASAKDRVLLRRTPHLVLDGALTVASAVGAAKIIVAVHEHATAAAVERAIAERADVRRRVQVRVIAGGFVSGEARAVVRALSGGPALPPGRREHTTAKGILLANVETFAQLAVLLRLGAHRFAATGTHLEPGTTLLTIGGAVARPGVVEIPIGTPLGIVLTAAGAHAATAIVTGGYHGSWLRPDPALPLSRAGLASVGGTFGAGVLLALDDSTCSLGELGRVTSWLASESVKQCGPCRFGLPALAADVAAIYRGDERGRAAAAHHAHAVTGRGACAHPDGTARFVTSGLHLLGGEIAAHLHGGCGRPVRGLLPTGGTS